MGRIVKKPRIFYGWWIIIGGILGNTVSGGFNFSALPAFVLPLSDAFGVTLTAVAAGLSVARLETAFLGPIEGYLVDRFGPRKMMFLGVPIMAMGFFLVSYSATFSSFLIPFLLGVVLGASLGFSSPLSTALANWWQRKRGRAFGIMWIGHSLGAMSVPLINLAIENFGWRWAFRIMGVVVLLVGTPVAALLRHRPEPYGLFPDGVEPDHEPLEPSGKGTDESSREFTVGQAIRTPTFWYFVVSMSVRTAITTAVAINSFPLVASLGGVPSQASLIILIQGSFSLPGRLFLSWAGDVIDKRYIMATCLLVMAVALLLMSRVSTVTQLAILWAPYALVWGGLSSLPNSLRADLFGRRNFATIQGTMSPLQTVASLVAPIITAWVYQTTGSYRVPFMIFGVMSLVSGWLILLARPPRTPVIHPTSR